EPLLEQQDTQSEAAVKLFQAQKRMPKNKRLMKVMQEPSVRQLVQRAELDYIADRKLPLGKQTMGDMEADLYFVMDERGHSVHLTDRGVETMSPNDPGLFVIPDISEQIGLIDKDESLDAETKLERRCTFEAASATK